MAHVTQRSSGRFAVVLSQTDPTTHKTRQKWITLPPDIRTRRDALRAAETLQANQDRRRSGLSPSQPASEGLFSEVASDVLSDFSPAQHEWQAQCESFARRFAAYHADPHVSSVTSADCRAYLRDRMAEINAPPAIPPSRPQSVSTLRKEIAFLRRVFRRAGELGLITANPWATVRPPAEPRHAPSYLTHDQAHALLEAAPPLRRLRWTFLLATGARRGEAERLTWRDVDLAAAAVRIPNSSKGRPPRYPHRLVPIPPALAKSLRAEAKRQTVRYKGPSTPGRPETAVADRRVLAPGRHWNRELDADLKAAGLPHFRVHDLRHTYGSWLAQAGVSLHQIRDLMGHASVTTTETYAHLCPIPNPATAAVFADLPISRALAKPKRRGLKQLAANSA